MKLKDYFYDSLARGFGNIIFTTHGSVAVSLLGDEKDTIVQPTAYDLPTAQLNQLSRDEKQKHIVFAKQYDITDVNFSDEYTVYKKLHFIIGDIEKELY